MQPKIGIVICGLEGNHQFVSNPYIQSVRFSHGLPLLLPLVRSEDLLNQYVSLCDGFLFCGGGDITPLLFGESPLPGNGRTSISTDIFQLHLMRQILSSRKPVFAICRGMQLLNVACGGTIWQDFSLIPGKTLDHMQQTDVRSDISHKIRIGRTGHLRKCLGTSLYVNSFHHQAVNLTGKGIIVTARACDETIEAIELKDYPFGVGVQWHPECMFRTSPEMRTLFKNFVEHCSVSGE